MYFANKSLTRMIGIFPVSFVAIVTKDISKNEFIGDQFSKKIVVEDFS